MAGSPKDRVGQRFGRLVVVSITWPGPRVNGKGSKAAVYHCLCDCGNTKDVYSGNLINGGVRSCGCLRKGLTSRRKLPALVCVIRFIVAYYKRNAGRRCIPWGLTEEQVTQLVQQPCYYCGEIGVTETNRHNNVIKHNGIDRLSSLAGYSLDNCVTCCRWCNQAKSDMTVDEFKAWLMKVYHGTVVHL